MSFVALWYHLKNLLQQRVLLGTVILWGLEVRLSFYDNNYSAEFNSELPEQHVFSGETAESNLRQPPSKSYQRMWLASMSPWPEHGNSRQVNIYISTSRV